MMKNYKILLVVFFAISQINCSAVSEALSQLTSLDCDDWVLSESGDSLSELCRDLEGYLDSNSSSLTGISGTGLSQILPSTSIVTDKVLFLQLTDSNGAPLSDLDLSHITDVEVSTDSGQTYTSVGADALSKVSETSTLNVSMMLTLDYSGSILDSDLDDINSGLHTLFDNLIADATSSVYQSAVTKFSTDVTLIEDFTSTKATLFTAIDDTSYTREYTSLYDAIYDSVESIKDEDTPLKLVLLFTDGVDNDSTFTKAEAIDHAVDNKVPVCVIGVGFADVATLDEIASDTGCFYIYKAFFTSLDEAFDSFAEQLNNFYVLNLPDSFSETSGLIKVTVDAGESEAREITQSF